MLALAALRPALRALPVALLGGGVGATAHLVSHIVGSDLGGRPASDIPTFGLIALLLLAAGWFAASGGDANDAAEGAAASSPVGADHTRTGSA